MTSAITINDIKREVRDSGSHWFDPDTMRFFGTRCSAKVYHGAGGIYFVTSEQGPHGPRAYTVRKYDRESFVISTVGELCQYSTGGQAHAAAKRLAGEDVAVADENYKPVSDLEQFLGDCRKHGNANATEADCRKLIAKAKTHDGYMVAHCNGDWPYGRSYNSDDGHPKEVEKCRKEIRALAKRLGAQDVVLGGDPRGCTCKLVWPGGETNDFGTVGWVVPFHNE